MNRDVALVLDIVVAARDAQLFVDWLDLDAFRNSRLHQAAHSAVPWSSMIGLRSRLIHGYGDVRLDIVWDVVCSQLPNLPEHLAPLVPPPPPAATAL